MDEFHCIEMSGFTVWSMQVNIFVSVYDVCRILMLKSINPVPHPPI